MPPPLSKSTLYAEGSYQASKWLDARVLLSVEELRRLLNALGEVYIFRLGSIVPEGHEGVDLEVFLNDYADYLAHVRADAPRARLQSFRQKFTLALSYCCDALFSLPAGNGSAIVKIKRPVVQVQLHQMQFSNFDKQFRSMVNSPDAFSWGLQFSYPQFVQDPHSKAINRAGDQDKYANALLFKNIQGYLREISVPTPFEVDRRRINIPARLGIQCFNWINECAFLHRLNLKVLPQKVGKP